MSSYNLSHPRSFTFSYFEDACRGRDVKEQWDLILLKEVLPSLIGSLSERRLLLLFKIKRLGFYFQEIRSDVG
jgi:hypothetical protein